MSNSYRTHTCGELRLSDAGKEVSLCGWLESIRHHGRVLFARLRDRYGMTQLRVDVNSSAWRVFEEVQRESVLRVSGIVEERPRNQRNPQMATGDIEVSVKNAEVLSEASPLPFEIKEADSVRESVRLKYRYLQMREGRLPEALLFRHRLITKIRDFLNGEGFIEVETPILTRSTPEGARDYLVPSRMSAGRFYALPQSPQLFKQLLMCGGMDKYYQIARCFRDEDLRADRQPEFTQLDIEMSFVNEEDVQDLVERLFCFLFSELKGEKLKRPFMRLNVKEALRLYGTDAPDLRYGIEIVDATEVLSRSDVEIFLRVIRAGGVVRGIKVPKTRLSRKQITSFEDAVKSCGAKGLAHFYVDGETLRSPLAKGLDSSATEGLIERFCAVSGDTILLVADDEKVAQTALGVLRCSVAERLNLQKGTENYFLWVVGWNMFEEDDEGRLTVLHHPFTSPHPDDIDLLKKEPLSVRARSYDIVLNGAELGGGSIRINDPELQLNILHLLGMDEKTAEERFGFLLEALRYGAPPHGGIAIGLDRVVAQLLGRDTINDVIAFPKTRTGFCPLTSSPAAVEEEQLKELHIKTTD